MGNGDKHVAMFWPNWQTRELAYVKHVAPQTVAALVRKYHDRGQQLTTKKVGAAEGMPQRPHPIDSVATATGGHGQPDFGDLVLNAFTAQQWVPGPKGPQKGDTSVPTDQLADHIESAGHPELSEVIRRSKQMDYPFPAKWFLQGSAAPRQVPFHNDVSMNLGVLPHTRPGTDPTVVFELAHRKVMTGGGSTMRGAVQWHAQVDRRTLAALLKRYRPKRVQGAGTYREFRPAQLSRSGVEDDLGDTPPEFLGKHANTDPAARERMALYLASKGHPELGEIVRGHDEQAQSAIHNWGIDSYPILRQNAYPHIVAHHSEDKQRWWVSLDHRVGGWHSEFVKPSNPAEVSALLQKYRPDHKPMTAPRATGVSHPLDSLGTSFGGHGQPDFSDLVGRWVDRAYRDPNEGSQEADHLAHHFEAAGHDELAHVLRQNNHNFDVHHMKWLVEKHPVAFQHPWMVSVGHGTHATLPDQPVGFVEFHHGNNGWSSTNHAVAPISHEQRDAMIAKYGPQKTQPTT
jgi:hypothetical protein